MGEDWKDLAQEDDLDPDVQMAALEMVQEREEAMSYPPLRGHRKKKGVVQWKSPVTYPFTMKLGTFLDRQKPNSGLKEEKLVSSYFGRGKPERTVVAPLPGIDVEKLSEEKVEELIENWEAGAKIEYILDKETGKKEPHVAMLSLTPNLMGPRREAVKVKETEKSDDSAGGHKAEAPPLNKGGKDPLPAIRCKLKKMAKREQKMKRRENTRTMVRLRNEKAARNRARHSRLKKKRSRNEAKKEALVKQREADCLKKKAEQECKSAGDPDEKEESKEKSKEKRGRPTKKFMIRERKIREKRREKKVRKILMAAPYNIMKESLEEKKPNEKKEKGKVTKGSRADRSEVIHETPLIRGGKKKEVNVARKVPKFGNNVERKEKVSPLLPSSPSHPKEPSELLDLGKPSAAASLDMTLQKQGSSEQEPTAKDIGPDLLFDMPAASERAEESAHFITGLGPLKPSHQKQSRLPSILSNQEACQLSCPALTDVSDEENAPPNLPSIQTNQEVPKSLSKLSAGNCQLLCPTLTDASNEERNLESGTRSRIRTKVKKHERQGKGNTATPISSEEEGEDEVVTRSRRKKHVKRARAKTPTLTSDSEEEKHSEEKLLKKITLTAMGNGDLRGGGPPLRFNQLFQEDFTMLEMLRMAIDETQLPLVIDTPTIADGNCFSHSMMQQFERPIVKAFLQQTGRHIATFFQLKNKVKRFVEENEDSEKIQALRENFELSQQNIHKEGVKGLQRRTWKQYWEDMGTDGEWADDTFIQATAFYVNMDILIIFAAQATRERLFGRMEGNFSSDVALNRQAPTLIVGYINTIRNNEHYQSLLPVEETNSQSRVQVPSTINDVMKKVVETLRREERKIMVEEKSNVVAPAALDDVLLRVLEAFRQKSEVSFDPNLFAVL